MKPWKALLCGLGLSGLILFGAAGCGGGDVPDAGSDAGEGAPPEPSLPAPGPAQDQAAPGDPGAPAAPGPAEPGPGADAPAPAEPAAPAAGGEPPAAKAEMNSATAEMLALATSPAPASAAAPGEPAASSPGAPGAPGGPGASDGQLFPPGPGASDGQLFPPGPAPGGGREQDASMLFGPDSSGAVAGSAGNPPGSGALMAPGGGQLGPGEDYGSAGPGSGGAQDNEPADTNSPDGAVRAFLKALEAKDRERLAEATALRAVSEIEGGSHRELFSRIFDNSISDTELDDLASALDGFKVSGFNQVKSTGRLGVTIRKNDEKGGWLQRTITVRKEKKGWGVLDISTQSKFNAGPMRGRTPGGVGGGRR